MNTGLGVDFLNEKQDYSNIQLALRTLSYNCEELNAQEYSWLSTHEMEKWDEYLKFRHSFRHDANQEKAGDFPIYMVIEPSSFCNLRCIMCFQNDGELRKRGGDMDIALWKKVVDEASEKGCKALTIAGRGEPLINKNIVEMLDYLKGKFLEIKLNTNGILMNDSTIRSILRNNINVVFSAEGSNEREYSAIRKGGDFNRLVSNIRRFSEIREKEFPESICRTRISGVSFDGIDIKRYSEFWKSLVDEVAIVEYEERKDTYHNNKIAQKNRCARLWQRVYVWYNGLVSPCDVDFLNKLNMGNANNDSIQNIWNSESFKEIRALHHDGKRNHIVPCDRCSFMNI